MASESAQAPMNGTYHGHHHPSHYANDPYNVHAAASSSSAHFGSSTQSASIGNESKNEIPKDEVGWFFVEQYYTTLSRSPEKLHLFYSRKSQFVSGLEAQKVTVAVGQKAIHERIAQLDFHDCKVRVLNVDSQASFENILVSVIGEISNKSEPPRKFVQTFVLAEQPNGYYVLNDIIRYLNDEDEELVSDAAPAVAEAVAEPEAPAEVAEEPKVAEAEVPVEEPQVEEKAVVEQVEEKPQVNGDAQAKAEEVVPQTNGTSVQHEQAAAPVVPAPVVPAPAEPKIEAPKEPEPAPAAAPTKAAAAPVKEAPAPARPMTWASIAGKTSAGAAAAVATPAPAVAPAAPTSQLKAAPTSTQPSTPPTGTNENATSQPSSNDTAGWQTAGADHGKKQSRPQSLSGPGDEHLVPAFVKNVNEKVDASLLRQTLSRFGKLKYFDVNRQKNCAFVEFADASGYAIAVAANPHQIGGEQVTVEERRPRSTAYGGNASFGPGRGGHRGRGDGRSSSQSRGGFQKDAGRGGGFSSRGRGSGNVTPKGRSQPQAA